MPPCQDQPESGISPKSYRAEASVGNEALAHRARGAAGYRVRQQLQEDASRLVERAGQDKRAVLREPVEPRFGDGVGVLPHESGDLRFVVAGALLKLAAR